MDKENNQNQKQQQSAVLGQPMSGVPKFATAVNFNKLENGNIVLSFFAQTLESASMVLIETIMVDENHAKEIVKILQEVIDKKI